MGKGGVKEKSVPLFIPLSNKEQCSNHTHTLITGLNVTGKTRESSAAIASSDKPHAHACLIDTHHQNLFLDAETLLPHPILPAPHLHYCSNNSFFHQVQTQKAPLSVQFVWGEVCKVGKCHSKHFWDRSKAWCQKNKQGWLITPTGAILCHNWSSHWGCSSTLCDQCHRCSREKDHRA